MNRYRVTITYQPLESVRRVHVSETVAWDSEIAGRQVWCHVHGNAGPSTLIRVKAHLLGLAKPGNNLTSVPVAIA